MDQSERTHKRMAARLPGRSQSCGFGRDDV